MPMDARRRSGGEKNGGEDLYIVSVSRTLVKRVKEGYRSRRWRRPVPRMSYRLAAGGT